MITPGPALCVLLASMWPRSSYTAIPPDDVAVCPANMDVTRDMSRCAAVDTRADGSARSLNYAGGAYNCEHAYHVDAHFPHVVGAEDNAVFADMSISHGGADIWLNLKYHVALRKWKWQDDSADLTWSNWEAGSEPSGERDECAVITRDGTWAVRDCAQHSAMVVCTIGQYLHNCAQGCGAGLCEFTGSEFKCSCPAHVYGDTCSETCGGQVHFGQSFHFHAAHYPRDCACTWTLPWPRGLPSTVGAVPAVTLSGRLEETPGCVGDYVKLYAGADMTDDTVSEDRRLATLCGDVAGTHYGTPGKSLILVLKSNSATEFPFSISKFDLAFQQK